MAKRALYNPTKQAEIHCALDVFLKAPGRLPVTASDIAHLNDLVTIILEAKWERDKQGNLPVDFLILDANGRAERSR